MLEPTAASPAALPARYAYQCWSPTAHSMCYSGRDTANPREGVIPNGLTTLTPAQAPGARGVGVNPPWQVPVSAAADKLKFIGTQGQGEQCGSFCAGLYIIIIPLGCRQSHVPVRINRNLFPRPTRHHGRPHTGTGHTNAQVIRTHRHAHQCKLYTANRQTQNKNTISPRTVRRRVGRTTATWARHARPLRVVQDGIVAFLGLLSDSGVPVHTVRTQRLGERAVAPRPHQ